jgi:iron complex outermembrane receptor protein
MPAAQPATTAPSSAHGALPVKPAPAPAPKHGNSAAASTSRPESAAPLAEVVVTAQRMPALAARTPVAISVLTGAELERIGIDRPADIGDRLPHVHLDGANDGVKITIRGVTNADTTEKGDPSAVFLVDGVVLARPQAQDLLLHDIERVEVLRGPQGTLYGRNSTGGVVHLISHAPSSQREGAAAFEIGDHGARRANAMLNLPVHPALALRASLAWERRDPFLINAQGTGHTLGLDRNARALRLSARATLSPQATLLLRYHTGLRRDHPDTIVPDTNFYRFSAGGQPQWFDASADARLTNAFRPPNVVPEQSHASKRQSGASAELNWRMGPATLTYVGGHQRLDHDFLSNYYYRVAPGMAIGVRQNFDGAYRQNTHELRLAAAELGNWTAQGGLYLLRESSQTSYRFRDLDLIGLTPWYVFAMGPTTAKARGLFGQATYRLRPGLRLTAGARSTRDEKSRVGTTGLQAGPAFNPATDLQLLNAASLSTHRTTWRVGAEADLGPATLLYANIATGYKSGGFNDGCPAGASDKGLACPPAVAVPAATLVYQPETLKSYEAGLKTRWWNRRATLNLALFDYDYRNLQLSGVAFVNGTPRFVTSNAGVASVKGIEADGQAAIGTAGQLTWSANWLDAHYVAYSPDGVTSWAGRPLDRAPRRTATLGYTHRFMLPGGQLQAGVNRRASATYSISVPTHGLEYRIPSHTRSDLNLGYRPHDADWRLQLRLKNLENKVRPLSIDSFGMAVPSDPRTLDVRFDVRF